MSPGKEICSFLNCSAVFQLEVLGEKLDLSDWLLLYANLSHVHRRILIFFSYAA